VSSQNIPNFQLPAAGSSIRSGKNPFSPLSKQARKSMPMILNSPQNNVLKKLEEIQKANEHLLRLESSGAALKASSLDSRKLGAMQKPLQRLSEVTKQEDAAKALGEAPKQGGESLESTRKSIHNMQIDSKPE
jgi:hypothetical protein